MLKHIAEVIPYLDCVKSYLDALQVNYKDLTPHLGYAGMLDPFSELNPDYMVVAIRYKDEGIKLTIRKDQWK